MGKYIIDVKDGETLYKAVIAPDGEPYITPAMGNVYTEPDTEKVREEAYQRGLNDAWEAARKIVALSTVDRRNVFGSEYLYSILEKHTASEANEKIRQYEQEKEEIQVGDEVEWMGDKYVVTYVRCEAKKADLISCKFGSVCENVAFSALVKTGRHFPEISEVLQKMKEGE